MKNFEIDENHRIEYNEETDFWDHYRYGELIPRQPEKLFKYYSLNTNNIDSLLSNYFHLSNPGTFNDPFDCNLNLIERIETDDWDQIKTVKRNNINNIGIASFSENINSHLMWAHYTNNYRGFAIEFKGSELQVKIRKGQFEKFDLTPVIYPKKIKQIKRDYPFAMHYVLTTKMHHWEYEKEWRIICQLSKENDRTLFYYPDKVKALYVGHQLIDDSFSSYRLLLEIHSIRFPDIPIYVVYPHKEKLELYFEKVMN